MSSPIAVVVGAGGELGGPVARNLAGSGYSVVAVDRNGESLDGLPDGVRREIADASDATVAGPLIERVVRDVGVPDVLVNGLGAFFPGPAVAATPAEFQTLIDVNLGAALWLSQAVAPHMADRGSGSIVHVSARPGIDPTAGMAAYAASKAALIQLTRVLDVELHPTGIRVNCVVPQLLDTKLNREFLPKELLDTAVGPAAVADIIAFLVSDAASPISGAILPVYG
jgi:NAD(P)-dependent dehydrogenase (short-subunit alcohol dehydrogenase family)